SRLGRGLLRGLGAVEENLGDADRRQELAMAALAARILAAALLEGDDLAAAPLCHDFGRDQRAVDERRTDGDLVSVAPGQHMADLDDVADFAGDIPDLQY